jgi:hypothetical protein
MASLLTAQSSRGSRGIPSCYRKAAITWTLLRVPRSELEQPILTRQNRRVKTQLRIVGILVLLLQGCATSPPSGPSALAGTWTNSFGTVWTVNADGSFDVDLDRDGKRDAWGTCIVSGNIVTITGLGETVKMPKGCVNTRATYRFHRTGDTLHFTLIKDPCKLRVKNVLKVWHRK